MNSREIHLSYRRLSGRVQHFRQQLVHATESCSITYLPSADLPKPMRIDDRVVLEAGAPIVWFTWPGQWFDVGRFHLANGTLTGYYANILTPVEMRGDAWETTDLCLDLWCGTDGQVAVLDEEDLREAEEKGWVTPEGAARAREEAERLLARIRGGDWPPEPVLEWTLTRARAEVDQPSASSR